MESIDYLNATECTEKKFPEGGVVKGHHVDILMGVITGMSGMANVIDGVKKDVIYGKEYSKEQFNNLFDDTPEPAMDHKDTNLGPMQMELLHAAMGKITETMEAVEPIIKYVFENADLDPVHLLEEVGDGWWYDMIIMRLLETSPSVVMEANIEKLAKRFPDGFKSVNANVRNLLEERGILDKHLK